MTPSFLKNLIYTQITKVLYNKFVANAIIYKNNVRKFSFPLPDRFFML